jgi:cobalt-zinc-cadmium efflux system outer membrane protein
MNSRNAVWYLSAGLLVLAGCKGIPTNEEKDARQKLQTVGHDYRPEDHKPPLPILTTNSSLGDFLKFAMFNQPSIEAAYYDWSASVERITTARSRPDPQLTFQMDIENIVSSVMPGFMVNFPGAGKLRAAGAIASAESQAKYFTFESAVLETTYEVKRVYYQLHYLEDRIRVSHATLELLSELEKLARAQNEVGKVTLQDVLRAQIEQNRLKADVANLEDSRNSLRAGLKSALGLGPNDGEPPEPKNFEPASLDLSSDKLLASAMEHSPRLKAMEAEVRAAEAAIVLANKGRNPDIGIGLMADARTSPVLYRPFATVSLPIWRDKIAAEIAEGQAAKKAAEARLSTEQIAIAVEFAERSVAFREANRNLEVLQNELVPKQQESLEVARSGYLAGQIDFFNLTDAEQTLLRFSLAEVDAREQRELALTELSLLTLGVRPNAPMSSPKPAMGAPTTEMKQSTPMPSSSRRMNRRL